jgi:quercetin dioxygenase-like cupin family protein
MSYLKHVADHTGASPQKFYKTTLFRSDAMLLGLNCLEPGQEQAAHDHAGQDKFYYVIEGTGRFQIGEEIFDAQPGATIWAAAGVIHGVVNSSDARLILLVGIAPAP